MTSQPAIELHEFRLIPWDIGYPISAEDSESIARWSTRTSSWAIEQKGRAADEDLVLSLRNIEPATSPVVRLFIFGDGVATFQIEEPPSGYESALDFDPQTHTSHKKSTHISILRGDHELIGTLRRAMADIRSICKARLMRSSASPTWENSGISYIFSFYLICVADSAQSEDICSKARRMLNPLHLDETTDARALAAIDLTYTVRSAENHESRFEFRPGLIVQSSWSTLCVVGSLRDSEREYICRLERFIQRSWYYCYVSRIHLKELLDRLRSVVPIGEVAAMGEIAGDCRLVTLRVKDLRSSMATQGEIKAYDDLVRTSRLEIHAENLEALASVFVDRLRNYIEQRRLASTRTIEITIVFLAIVSATADFTTLLKDSTNRPWQLNFVLTVFSVLVVAWAFIRRVHPNHWGSSRRSFMHTDIRILLRRLRLFLRR